MLKTQESPQLPPDTPIVVLDQEDPGFDPYSRILGQIRAYTRLRHCLEMQWYAWLCQKLG